MVWRGKEIECCFSGSILCANLHCSIWPAYAFFQLLQSKLFISVVCSLCLASIPCYPALFSGKTKGRLSAASEKHGSKLAFEHIAVFLIEFVHTAGAIHDLLFTSVERVALRANFNVEFGFAHGRFSGEFVTARAGNIDFMVVGMNFRFHGFSFKKRV